VGFRPVVDLSEAALEAVIQEIETRTTTLSDALKITPTKLIMVRYPNESDEEWLQRCAMAQIIVENLKKKNSGPHGV